MKELNNMEMQDINGGEFFKWLGKKTGEAVHSALSDFKHNFNAHPGESTKPIRDMYNIC
ncbi:MAG: hypothetical protein ACRC7R_06860 [Sarcina sp.]